MMCPFYYGPPAGNGIYFPTKASVQASPILWDTAAFDWKGPFDTFEAAKAAAERDGWSSVEQQDEGLGGMLPDAAWRRMAMKLYRRSSSGMIWVADTRQTSAWFGPFSNIERARVVALAAGWPAADVERQDPNEMFPLPADAIHAVSLRRIERAPAQPAAVAAEPQPAAEATTESAMGPSPLFHIGKQGLYFPVYASVRPDAEQTGRYLSERVWKGPFATLEDAEAAALRDGWSPWYVQRSSDALRDPATGEIEVLPQASYNRQAMRLFRRGEDGTSIYLDARLGDRWAGPYPSMQRARRAAVAIGWPSDVVALQDDEEMLPLPPGAKGLMGQPISGVAAPPGTDSPALEIIEDRPAPPPPPPRAQRLTAPGSHLFQAQLAGGRGQLPDHVTPASPAQAEPELAATPELPATAAEENKVNQVSVLAEIDGALFVRPFSSDRTYYGPFPGIKSAREAALAAGWTPEALKGAITSPIPGYAFRAAAECPRVLLPPVQPALVESGERNLALAAPQALLRGATDALAVSAKAAAIDVGLRAAGDLAGALGARIGFEGPARFGLAAVTTFVGALTGQAGLREAGVAMLAHSTAKVVGDAARAKINDVVARALGDGSLVNDLVLDDGGAAPAVAAPAPADEAVVEAEVAEDDLPTVEIEIGELTPAEQEVQYV